MANVSLLLAGPQTARVGRSWKRVVHIKQLVISESYHVIYHYGMRNSRFVQFSIISYSFLSFSCFCMCLLFLLLA